MTYKEFTETFKKHISSLTYERQYSLAISVCKDLFSDYKDFYHDNGWGNPDLLIDGIEQCQLYFKQKASADSLKEILKKVDSITPDSEDFGNSSCALNACTAVADTKEFLLDKDQIHIISIGTYLTDTVDVKIQGDDDLSQEAIDNNPMMIEARKFLLAS